MTEQWRAVRDFCHLLKVNGYSHDPFVYRDTRDCYIVSSERWFAWVEVDGTVKLSVNGIVHSSNNGYTNDVARLVHFLETLSLE